jgi:hypothetical protein
VGVQIPVVFIPKCRRKTLYLELRRHLGEVFHKPPALPGILTLAVKPQEVVPDQAESADGWLFGEASMRPVPIVAMECSQGRSA